MSNSGKATLENSIKGDIDLELIGSTEQPTTTGKNLFDPKQLQGISGFTIEGNEITQSGYNVSTGKTLKQLCPEITPGIYILSANNGDFTGLFGITKPMYKKSAIEIVDEDLNRIVALVGNPNKTIKYTLQIEKGNTVTPYEPYTGLKPSPSPEYPQEIKSAGRKSKNLFDINYFKDKSNLKMLQCEGFTLLGIICNVKPSTNYTLSANITEAQYNLNIANKTQRFSLTSSSARTLMSNDDGTLYIGLFNTTADAVNMYDFMQQYKNIQLEKGNTVTYYEAYSDKYLLDVKVTGKNLFDVSQFADPENIIGRKDFILQPSEFKVGMTYTCSAKIKSNLSDMNRVRIDLLYEDGTNGNTYGNQVSSGITKCSFTPNKKIKTLKFILQSDADSSSRWTDVMIEHGNKLTEYEPYQEPQTLTLTSDRPITKWDKLVEQGGSMGWLYSGKIAKEFTFVSKASDENISGRIRRRFKTSLNGKFPQTDKVMCNFLTTDNVRNDYSIGIVGSGDIYIYFYENTGVETLEQANHWLKNLPFEKTIIFERKTTEFVPLSESEQTQLRNLHSYIGTTNIMVDSGEIPCGIKVAYKQKK